MKTNPWEDKYQEIMKNQQKESMDFSMDDLIEVAKPEKSNKPIFYWFGGIAASILVVFVAGYFWMNHETNNLNKMVVEQNETILTQKDVIKPLPIQIPALKKVVSEPTLVKAKVDALPQKEERIKHTAKKNIQKPLLQQKENALVMINGRPIYNKEIAMEEVNYALIQVDEKFKKVSKYTKEIEQIMIKI